jgi:hypothetical protein
MKNKAVNTLVDRLAELLEKLTAKQESIRAVIRKKLEAMRRADVEAMIAASHREGELVNDVTGLEVERREISEKLGEVAGARGTARGRGLPLRVIAAQLDDADRARITRLADALRRRMLEVAEANRVVELVSREMLAFFKDIFTAIVRDGAAPLTYSAGGEIGAPVGARVLDAVG